ncbi:hypothetical protein GIB67_021300 [Kingdonia uniflora]|uniref:Replication protein A 70 kDa DNA-binding subunit B/D first OB fold domain-containing protein n=1 Tax=Kingdonia uniflora TaxID=39325 RepID=A0A7J7LY44_9MAGN|nr:hypothetical protein GIB67_021300 [Kingdonia uniflora]
MTTKSYNLIEKFNHTIDRWKIKVRISRMWYMYDFIDKKDINRIDMLLIDEKGDQIHAIIYKKLVSSNEKTLQEGNVFLIDRFSVEHQQGNYRPCDNKYKITFKWDTKVTFMEGMHDQIPLYKCQFVNFRDIPSRHNINMFLTDQIPQNIFEEKDAKVIVIATSTIVKEFQGIFHLSSTMSTKLYFNLPIPDVDNFKDWYCLRLKIEDVIGYLNVIAFENKAETLTKTPAKALTRMIQVKLPLTQKVKQINAIGSEEAPNYKLKRKLRKIIYDGNNE